MLDGPSVYRRQLGSWLQSLREQAGKTQSQIAAQRRWDTSKVSRIETGRVRVHPSDLMILFEVYGVTDEVTRQEMLRLAERSRADPGGFVAANAVRLRPGGFLNFERDATAITVWEPNLVPGLLQTRRYASALYRVGMPQASEQDQEARVKIRLDRQRLLDDGCQPSLTVVVDESVLHRQIGGREVHLEQLEQMGIRAQQSHVNFHVMPYVASANPLPHGPATLLEFESAPDLNLVYLEGVAGDYYATKPKDYSLYRELIDQVVALALPTTESIALLSRIRSSLTPS